ncbi:MAG: antitoxin [Methyloprofundus sp.]|nr:MAG: antitoxin [Methyloprofundus sp.]
MITLEPQLEQQLKSLASKEGVSISELIQNLFLDYQLRQDALNRADRSYADYKKTGESISLDQLIKNNELDS